MQEPKNDPAVSECRVDALEKEYEAAHADPESQARLEELHFQLSGLLGKNNLCLLREYTDRLIARYNKDPEWFYRNGAEDARRLPLAAHRPEPVRLGGR